MREKLSKSKFNKIIKDLGYWNYCNEYVEEPFEARRYHLYSSEDREKEKKRVKILESKGYCIVVTSITGADGGNCWNDNEPQPFSREVDNTEDPIINILNKVCPEITLLKFKALSERVERHDFYKRQNEYYGNYTKYTGYYYLWNEFYQCMVDLEIVEPPVKEAVLIGGLPCSGKTILAKEGYSDYTLIDDPKELDQITKKLKEDKIVITHPQLSFKKDRNELRTLLEGEGYDVTERVLKVNKNTLKSRARKRKGDHSEVMGFIDQFQVEL